MADGAVSGVRVILLLVAVGAVGGSYALWQRSQPDEVAPVPDPVADAVTAVPEAAVSVPAEPEVTADAVAPDVAEKGTVAPTAQVDATPEPAAPPEVAPPPPVAPTFDVVRIEADGAALIAGTVPADARVSLQLDGVEELRLQAGADGAFVAQFTLPPNPAPRLLSMVAILADGTEIAADESVAVAPIAVIVPDATLTPPAPPAAILLTEEGAEVLQGPEPAAPLVAAADVTLDTIAYAPDGAVQLSGRGQGDGGLRIYLDNAAVMDAAIGADGKWAVTLPATAPGIYTLRIDQLGADGTVSSRFETPFKRETLEALAVASGGGTAAPEPAPEPAPEVVSEAVPAPVIAAIAPEAEVVAEAEVPAPVPEPAVDPVAEATPDPAVTPAEEATPDPVAEPVVETAPEPVAEPAPVVVAAEPEPVAAPAPEDQTTAEVTPQAVPDAVEPEQAVAATIAEPVKAPVTVTVQPGFTLWGIATERFGEGTMYVQVFEANRDSIKDPDLIYPGQVFTLPQE